MARITACILRIAAICLPKNLNLTIASSVFVAAGIIIVYVVNLIFTQRILRAQHPNSGWHPVFRAFFIGIYFLIGATIVMVITVTIQSFFTLNPNIRRIGRDIQLYGTTMFAVITFLPIPLLAIGLLIPRRQRVDKFGTGRFRTKIIILLISSFLVTLGASYKAGTTWKKPVPVTQPMPAYFSKGAFYTMNFAIDIIVLYLYALLRIDLRFWIPNGAKGPGSYSAGKVDQATGSLEKRVSDAEPTSPRIFTEEETFDDAESDEERHAKKSKDIEASPH